MSSSFAAAFLTATVAIQGNAGLQKKLATEEAKAALPHLIGIFIQLDTDADGYLTRPQLETALTYVGLVAREELVKKYLDASAKSGVAKRATMSLGVTRRTSQAILSRVDLPTFITVTVGELGKIKSASREIDPLLKFMSIDNADPGLISVRQLRHLLVETLSPSRLDEREFRVFLETLGLTNSTLSRSAQEEKLIAIEDLKRKLILQL
jgi:Ca2+-binding EF-hand superfamily protein